MDLEVRHLRLMQTVATLGSLTAAADRLNLTQSALSHQLRDIEDRLGTPLFLRRNRRMVATPAGQRVLDSATTILAELERTEAAVRALAKNRQGLLRVATECYTCYHWLPHVLKDFGQKCPSVEVRIEVEALSFISRTASTGSWATSWVFAQERGSLSVAENTTFEKPARTSVPGSPAAANPDMRRYVVAPIRTV